ncbi:hypothetical protein HPB47_026866, partial [Ixodes persulcatus]
DPSRSFCNCRLSVEWSTQKTVRHGAAAGIHADIFPLNRCYWLKMRGRLASWR